MANSNIQPQNQLLNRIGLSFNPFPVTPDAGNYFLSDRTYEKLTELLHCIESRKGFMLVTADIGLGKTTLSRRLILELNQRSTDVALIINSFLHGESLLRAIVADFGLYAEGNIVDLMNTLNRHLLDKFRASQNCCIIIDDAQNLDLESLELIRQLSNLETNQHKLVQILLIAQPEIQTTLAYPEIRQLNSRIALHVELEPFTQDETRDYIEYRLGCADNQEDIQLSKRGLKRLWNESEGYPRQINLIMDRALYALMVKDTRQISESLMQAAISDLGRLKPSPQRTLSRWPALAACLIIASGLGYLIQHPDVHLGERLKQVFRQLSTDDHSVTVASVPAEISTPSHPTTLDTTPVDPKQARFLSYYGLEPLAQSLNTALKTHQWTRFEQALQHTPWQLVHSSLPRISAFNAGVLKFQNAEGGHRWVFLWQPPYRIKQFHFGAESSAIRQLQNQLAQLGHYATQPDGVVGARTKTALARFQEQAGLIPSGDINPLTLYLLHQAVPDQARSLSITARDVTP